MTQKAVSSATPALPSDIDWIKLREDMDDEFSKETFSEKLVRKFKEQPLVPVGCLLTSGALAYGLYSLKVGNQQMSQYMMRTRVIAQGFTVVVAIVGTLAASGKMSSSQ